MLPGLFRECLVGPGVGEFMNSNPGASATDALAFVEAARTEYEATHPDG